MKLLTSVLLSTSLIVSTAVSAEPVRLVISSDISTTLNHAKSASAVNTGCVTSKLNDAKWCLPDKHQMKAQSSNPSERKYSGIVVFEVDNQGYSAKQIADYFNQDGRFGLVEIDVPISTHSFRPNDPQHGTQETYFTSSTHSNSGANIYGLWDALGQDVVINKSHAIDIIVMDSVFQGNIDFPYFDGRNFSTTALEKGGEPQPRSDDFSPPIETEELHCDAHGLGVASIIGANIDNSTGISGVTNNANIYAIRVLTCGSGFLSDASEALQWLAGKSVDGVTPYQGKPGIVNMSLGGSSGTCPKYMQNGVDAAIEAGFTLVASSGNDSIDAVQNTPSNCEGVLGVGAINKSGELADFSNFGSSVDVVAQGVDILGYCNSENDSACWWEGTSFSTPLVTGGLAVIKQVTSASNEELTAALQVSSKLESLGADCQAGICGQGLPDFAKALEISQRLISGTLHSIEFALNDSDVCEQTWLIDHFGAQARMCELFKVSFYGGYIGSNMTYQLFSINVDSSWDNSEKVSEGIFDEGTVLLSSLDVANKKYGFKVCQNGLCGEIIDMDISDANDDSRPVACKEP
jgi:serine protease